MILVKPSFKLKWIMGEGFDGGPLEIIEDAGRVCYKSEGKKVVNVTKPSAPKFVKMMKDRGHHSVLEHASFTFAISGISRVVSHQLVRHRIASYSQLSQQKSDASELEFVVPPDIRRAGELTFEYAELMSRCQEFYKKLVDRGVSLGTARYALPSGFSTRIVMTMNARSLLNLIAQRECAAEEWEFRQLATAIRRELMGVAPRIFKHAGTECETHHVCPEGELGLNCGRLENTGAIVDNTRDAILLKMEA